MDTELQTTQQVPATNAGSSKSRLVAFLLCTFAGFVGAHNFYVGRTVRGIIQLVLMIGGFILYGVAIVTLATMSTKVDNGADVEIALIVGILLSLGTRSSWSHMDLYRLDYGFGRSIQGQE